MLDENFIDKLKKILHMLETNFQRLDYAYSRIEYLLPFTETVVKNLEVLPDKNEWLYLRKLRNEVSHEYPLVDEEAVVALNSLFNSKAKLSVFFKSCVEYLKNRSIL